MRNAGNSLTISGATVRFTCDDPWVFAINSYYISLPEMAPGKTVQSTLPIVVSYIDSLFPGYFHLKSRTTINYWASWIDSIRIDVITTGVKEEISTPLNFHLSQNYPNPFNPTTKIKYSIPQTSNVVIKIFDILGNEIETLVNEEKPVGTYELTWNAESLAKRSLFLSVKSRFFC